VSIDYLGEDVTDTATADATVQAYLNLLEALAQRREPDHPVRPLEVSLKLSALGQALPRDGQQVALATPAPSASGHNGRVWVTVDAEDHTTTDSTLAVVRALREDFPWVGTVLQAYLKRTPADCADFADARIRLCKGAYDEPATVAHRDAEQVTVPICAVCAS
jgi:proline dehydrogenase